MREHIFVLSYFCDLAKRERLEGVSEMYLNQRFWLLCGEQSLSSVSCRINALSEVYRGLENFVNTFTSMLV